MPNCFTLMKKGENQSTPFNKIDDEICEMLGVTPDEHKYRSSWYDIIGLRLAMGQSLEKIIEELEKFRDESPFDRELHQIAVWLNEHYKSDAWAQIGR